MEERELCSIIEDEVRTAIGQFNGDLSDDRATELDYYNSEPFGNEVEGESQVVSSDVFDAVEGMLPALLRIFTASDDVVRFEPTGPEDEEAASQRTELCNYVFYRQNKGFLILYEWFKDALIQKNGIVKYWWEERETITEEDYAGLSDQQYVKLANDPDTEILEHTEYPDETVQEQIQQKLTEALERLKQQAANMPPEQVAMIQQQIEQQAAAMPIPNLHDVKIKITKDTSKVCIETVPPEEFGISKKQKCVSIQDTPFCFHKTRKTISYLREMGYDESLIAEIGSGEDDTIDRSPETLARDRLFDQIRPSTEGTDESMREVWVTDCFIRIDYDGDNIAELRHIIKAGNVILSNDVCSHINFAAITPIIMPHRWVGKSVAELVMADQFEKSILKREMLNNLYLTNRPRKAVLSSASGVMQANLDDLMNYRAGGIMREYVPGAIRNEEVPFVAGAAFPMLEYIDAQKETRTGLSRYNQGTDADSLNKTARGIQMIQQAGQQRGDLIARIFAETGVKDLMSGIAYMLSKYPSKPMTVRLRNKWVDIDPREWKNQFDMTINVGLGTGNKDVMLAHLAAMGAKQLELMQTGKGYMVTDENVYNLYKKTAEAMGFKHPELFVSSPDSVKPPPPQPSPEMLKIQADKDTDDKKIQSAQQIRQFDAQTNKEIETIRGQIQLQVAQLQQAGKEQLARIQQEHDAKMKIFEKSQPVDNTDAGLKAQIEDMKAQLALTLEREQIASAERIAAAARQLEQWRVEFEANTKVTLANMAAASAKKEAKENGAKGSNGAKSEQPKLPDIHVHMPSGKKKVTGPNGDTYSVENVD